MLYNSSATIYFNDILFHSKLNPKYGVAAKRLMDVVKDFREKNDRVLLCEEKLNDDSYKQDGIHLTNKALCNLRRKQILLS